MQLASVTVLGHGAGKLGNDPKFVNDTLRAFRDQYDRERNAFIQSNGRSVEKLENFLAAIYGALSKNEHERKRQLKEYKGFMSKDLRNLVAWGMLPQNL